MSRARPAAPAPPDLARRQVCAAWQSASLLLDYPDQRLGERLAVAGRAAELLPPRLAGPIRDVAAYLRDTPLVQAQSAYVETFDSRRRCNLFLTYFAHGDTRKRGMALLRFKQTYLASGFALAEDELPDHLCVVLEYAATVDYASGRRLILDHRAGLELLRLSLREIASPWAPLLDLVCAPLPSLRGDERDAVRRLAASGPPEEEVGLAPFATPEFSGDLPSAGTGHPAGPTALPMPSFPGGRR